MVKRIVLGLVYFVVFYILILIGIGVCTGAYDGWTKQRSQTIDYRETRGAHVAVNNRIYVVTGAVLLSGLGTIAGVLPGTRARQAEQG